MKQYNRINGLSLLCFDEDSPMPSATKMDSYGTQRTVSRESRSIESDTNSLFDSDYLSFGEQKPDLGRRNRQIKTQPDCNNRHCTLSVISPGSPTRHHVSNLRRQKEENKPPIGIPYSPKDCHSKSHDSPKQSKNIQSVHTLTDTIPLFEQAESISKKKNASQNKSTRQRSSSFSYFTKRHAAVHNVLKKEHQIEEQYDFFANETNALKTSRYSHPRAKSMKQLYNSTAAVEEMFAGADVGKINNSSSKKVERSIKRHHDMQNVQLQAKFFMDGCKIDHCSR